MSSSKKVRKTMDHEGWRDKPQHVYLRLTRSDRNKYNSIIGGFKHFMGPQASGADIFATYGLPAMAAALKDYIAKHGTARGKHGTDGALPRTPKEPGAKHGTDGAKPRTPKEPGAKHGTDGGRPPHPQGRTGKGVAA